MEVQKFHASRKFRKSHKDLTSQCDEKNSDSIADELSTPERLRLELNHCVGCPREHRELEVQNRRTPKYNSRVLIGNWYEELRNNSEKYKYHSQTEYQRQFSIKVIPQFKRSATVGDICKQFKHGSATENKSQDDHYLSTYDLSFKYAPHGQEIYNRCDVPMEGAQIGDFGDRGDVEANFV